MSGNEPGLNTRLKMGCINRECTAGEAHTMDKQIGPPPDGPSSYARIGQQFRCSVCKQWGEPCRVKECTGTREGSITPHQPVFADNQATLSLEDGTTLSVAHTLDKLDRIDGKKYIGISGQDCNGRVVAVSVHGFGVLKTATVFTLGSIIGVTTDLKVVAHTTGKTERIAIVLPSPFLPPFVSVMVAH
jgi:hypothetical protein